MCYTLRVIIDMFTRYPIHIEHSISSAHLVQGNERETVHLNGSIHLNVTGSVHGRTNSSDIKFN